jgi:hypothetical protein
VHPIIAALTAATPTPTASAPEWAWDWTVAPTAAVMSGIAAITAAGILDFFGIGPDHWCDRAAAVLVMTGTAHLMIFGPGQTNIVLLQWLHMHALWAAFVTDMIGVVALLMLIGAILPDKLKPKAGRICRFKFARKKKDARFNPKVWFIPGLVGAFPFTSGLIGLVTYPILAGFQNAGSYGVYFFLGY